MAGTKNTETQIHYPWPQETHILVERKTSKQMFMNL